MDGGRGLRGLSPGRWPEHEASSGGGGGGHGGGGCAVRRGELPDVEICVRSAPTEFTQ